MEPASPSGPVGWRNWKAASANKPVVGTLEYALYTDAGVTNEITTGPHFWINTVAGTFKPIVGKAELAIVLRADIHLPDEEFAPLQIDWDKRNTKDYIAGDLDDEIAQLAALALGCRLRSGGLTRRFDVGDDRGTPYEGWHRRPRLTPPEPGARSILPYVEAAVDLSHAVELLEIYPTLALNDARALARASRLYAQALWVADDDPAQAWLRLVSALEAAANQWKAPAKQDPIEVLQLADPELAELIAKAPPEVADELTKKLAPTAKATAKFLQFTLEHLPDPPAKRPEFGQVDWNNMEKALRMIYSHRSLDLHAGIPFPGPLCAVPMTDEQGVATEKIHSFGVAGQGAVWTEDDLPMHLHTFAYITGGAIRRWWANMAASA